MGLFGKKDKTKVFTVVHVTGLDIPENCKCEVFSENSEIIIKSCGKEIVLKTERVSSVDHQMDIDEKQYLKSSFAKGAIGAATFGVAGAVIGSAPKTKTKREVKSYAIIAYESAEKDNITIVLKDEFPNTLQCAKLIDELKPQIRVRTNRVEL